MTIADFIDLMQLSKGLLVTWTGTQRQYTGTLRYYRFEKTGWWLFKEWTVQFVLEVENPKITKTEFFSLSSIDAISIGEGEVEFSAKRSWRRHYRFRFSNHTKGARHAK